MGVYGLAKVTTMLEICLTCNVLLFCEFYGIFEKKCVYIIIGIFYRCLVILLYVIVAIVLLTYIGENWYKIYIPATSTSSFFHFHSFNIYFLFSLNLLMPGSTSSTLASMGVNNQQLNDALGDYR